VYGVSVSKGQVQVLKPVKEWVMDSMSFQKWLQAKLLAVAIYNITVRVTDGLLLI